MPYQHKDMDMEKNQLRSLRTASAAAAALCAVMVGQQAFAAISPEVYPTATASTAPSPKADPFYASPGMATLLATAPGNILKVRPIVPMATSSKQMPAKAWQLMVRSTDHKGRAVASITTVFLPTNAPAKDRKVVVHNTAYDSLTLDATPSYAYVKGGGPGEQSTIQSFLDKGYVVVSPDYEGLESLWAVGKNAGQAVLDAIRAAESWTELGLNGAATPIAITGYSGGSVAATWANEMYLRYAPELNIRGVAAGGIPVDAGHVGRKVNKKLFAGIYFGVVTAYARAYPEINADALTNDKGKAMLAAVSNMSANGTPSLFSYAYKDMHDYVTVPELLDLPEVEAVIADNRLGQAKPGAPTLLYQGTLDQIMPYEDVKALSAQYCSQGVKVQLKGIFGEHILGLLGANAVKTYVDDVFGGKVVSNCP